MKDDKVLKIFEDVSWIGVLDPGIRTFDVVMTTGSGTTYNQSLNTSSNVIFKSINLTVNEYRFTGFCLLFVFLKPPMTPDIKKAVIGYQ